MYLHHYFIHYLLHEYLVLGELQQGHEAKMRYECTKLILCNNNDVRS